MTRWKLPDGSVVAFDAEFIETRTRPEETTGPDGEVVIVQVDDSLVHTISLLPPEELQRLGITAVIDDPRPDERFYFVNEDLANPGKWISTPKDLDQLKAQAVSQIKTTAGTILSASDWEVTRSVEDGVALDADLKAYRASVREYSNTLEAQLTGLDFEGFVTWATTAQEWPVRGSTDEPAAPTG